MKNKYLIIITVVALIGFSAVAALLLNSKRQEQPLISVNVNKAQGKIMLTEENIGKYNSQALEEDSACKIKFNQDQPNESIDYSNKDLGLALKIPYNADWGNETYSIAPYFFDGKMLTFGSLAPFEGCAWVREFNLSVIDQKDPAQRLAELKKETDVYQDGELVPHTEKIGQLTAIIYESFGMCNYPTVELVGQKYNYQFGGPCDANLAELKKIAASVQLID